MREGHRSLSRFAGSGFSEDEIKEDQKEPVKPAGEIPHPCSFPLPDLLIRLLSLVYIYENTGC